MPGGLSALGQKVFTAMLTYGVYITDNGGGQSAIRSQANAYDSTTINALITDVQTLIPLLKLVT
jgi:hypothetical protein